MRVDELLKEKEVAREQIVSRSKPLREQRDALLAKAQPLQDQARELTKQIQAIENDGEESLFDLDNEIGALKRALGARHFKAS